MASETKNWVFHLYLKYKILHNNSCSSCTSTVPVADHLPELLVVLIPVVTSNTLLLSVPWTLLVLWWGCALCSFHFAASQAAVGRREARGVLSSPCAANKASDSSCEGLLYGLRRFLFCVAGCGLAGFWWFPPGSLSINTAAPAPRNTRVHRSS